MVETILAQLLFNREYFTKVWPYMAAEYFDSGPAQTLFKVMKDHVSEYSSIPSKNALDIALDNSTASEVEVSGAKKLLGTLAQTNEDQEWLVKETEKYVQKAAMYNATSRIIEIQTNADLPLEKQNKKLPGVGAIPEIMRDALAICFDAELGHDWMDDYEERWMSYQNKTAKIPFRLNILNRITKGGAERKTLNVLMAGVNVGKSLGLCSLAADYLQSGLNVLYISMEMAEEVCAKRIDANLLDVSLDDIDDGNISYAEYKAKMEKWRSNNSLGRLKIKQYPTGGANANTFRAYLNELKLKANFVPDVIIIDYLAICGSSRIKQFSENSYAIVKAVAEELRGLAVDTNTILWTGAQVGRGAWDASDIDMADVAESAGLPATADFMLAIIETEEFAQMGVQLFKQIKSRYGDKNYINKFQVGVKKGNQRWVEVENNDLPTQSNTVNEAAGAMQKQAEQGRQSRVDRSDLDNLAASLKF
ncbi:DNA helicase [Kosakonia phage Kc304]|uniref:DnaB-like replicative helicase n=3 Tax=Winklervirus TaxID=2560256 RepID=A0A1Z1LY20_9CAUD|nr:putative DNA primase/helicase [Serratia phage CHI14]ARW57730.1 putative DNA primase/helicase [Serratia phage CBH8]QYN80477.1 DNA helicase [Kosakonia phage Kc304]UJJ22014.1 DNA helicase [Erwinia phage Virsaitis27]UYM28684.1 DNA primase-helicase subunit [Serratia phage vB_SspM_LC53]ARW57455.1 putative DNA primase/helicase [Serratia phage CHI14]